MNDSKRRSGEGCLYLAVIAVVALAVSGVWGTIGQIVGIILMVGFLLAVCLVFGSIALQVAKGIIKAISSRKGAVRIFLIIWTFPLLMGLFPLIILAILGQVIGSVMESRGTRIIQIIRSSMDWHTW